MPKLEASLTFGAEAGADFTLVVNTTAAATEILGTAFVPIAGVDRSIFGSSFVVLEVAAVWLEASAVFGSVLRDSCFVGFFGAVAAVTGRAALGGGESALTEQHSL